MSKDEVYSEEVMEKIRSERTLEQIIRSDDYELRYSEEEGWRIIASDEEQTQII